MLREEKKRRASDVATLPVRLRQIAGVWTFYAIIDIWNVPPPGVTFHEAIDVWDVPPPGVDLIGRTDVFMSLFGL